MKRGLWIAIGAAGLVAGACTYPDFEFRSEGAGGNGGGGGDGGSAGGAPGTGGAGGEGGAGGAPGIAIVPCDNGAITCEVGQGCCFDLFEPIVDFCGQPGQCGEMYSSLRCNSAADCTNGEACCGTLNGGMPPLFLGTICRPTCETTESTVCDPASLEMECPTTCVATPYNGYGHCDEG